MSDIDERTSDWTHAQEWAADLNDDLLQDISSGAVSIQPAEADDLLLKHATTLLKASAFTSARGSAPIPDPGLTAAPTELRGSGSIM